MLSLNYLGNHGSHLHDGSIWPYNFPTQSTYLNLYNSGHAQDTVTDPASAAAAGVPCPFPGFSGYAYQAITPYPQISSQAPQNGLFLVNADISVSNYEAMVAEVRTKNVHGLTMDVNYTLSRTTGSASPNGAFADSLSGSILTQDPYLLPKLTDQLTPWDYTHFMKGYVLYDLPIGQGQQWKTNRYWLDNFILGGWKIGMQLSYHTGDHSGGDTVSGLVGSICAEKFERASVQRHVQGVQPSLGRGRRRRAGPRQPLLQCECFLPARSGNVLYGEVFLYGVSEGLWLRG